MKAKFKPAADNFTGFKGTQTLDTDDPQVQSWWGAGAIKRVVYKKKKIEKVSK